MNDLSVIVVTYKTKKEILIKCLNSIEKKSKIIIIENSRNFNDKKYFLKKFKNLKIFCTNSNIGYGAGNNYGLKKVKTKYAMILNPDTICSKNFFKNLNNNINQIKDFHIIGCQNKQKQIPAGFFKKNEDLSFKEKAEKNMLKNIEKVNWVKGFSLILNLKKFKNKKNFFDENFFLFLEEIDLCQKITKNNGKIYFCKNLIVKHLGFKSSFVSNKEEERDLNNLKNWHYMWSSFYYFKKNYGFFNALFKMSGKLLSSFIKIIIFTFFFNFKKKEKYIYRFKGLLCSILGYPSKFRTKNFY